MLDFGLIVVIHGQRGVEQRGEQVCADITDLCGIAAQTLKHIDHQRVVQSVEAGLHLWQRDMFSPPIRTVDCVEHITSAISPTTSSTSSALNC